MKIFTTSAFRMNKSKDANTLNIKVVLCDGVSLFAHLSSFARNFTGTLKIYYNTNYDGLKNNMV
uniref:Uncharacterized protein n=1 Tax=Arundo donax TaxID=35708 RepID=A0A0A8ZUS1_ARUDO